MRKLDFRLIPWLCLLYLVSFLDRMAGSNFLQSVFRASKIKAGVLTGTNIGNAKIEGLIGDLGMTSGQYSFCLTIFFVSYAVRHSPPPPRGFGVRRE